MTYDTSSYLFQNPVKIFKYLIVPEPQHFKALRAKPGISPGITHIIGVLAAIQFNDKLPVKRREVHNVLPDGFLSSELDPFHLVCLLQSFQMHFS